MSRFSNASTAELRSRLPALMLRDERRLGRRLEGVRKMHGATQRRSAIDAITADVARAELRVANRRAAVPTISYPPELPVSQLRDEILAAIMHERQTELFTEWGNRWYDLKRTGTAGAVLSAEKSGWHARDTLYPVPNAQRQINNLLLQNPGYN